MKKWLPILYTLTICSFFLTPIRIPVISGAGFWLRWGMLAVTAVALLCTGIPPIRRHPRALYAGLFVFVMYSLTTMFWSENAYLSAAKSVAFVAEALVLFVGGLVFGQVESSRNPFYMLAPLCLFAVAGSVLVLVTGDPGAYTGGLFKGPVSNPNMFGSYLAFSMPWVVMELYRDWNTNRRAPMLVLAAVSLVILAMTRSRSNMLMVGIIAVFVLAAAKPKGKIGMTSAMGIAAVLIYVLAPAFLARLDERYVRKDASGIFSSREDVFATSYAKAKEAGLFGVGFGISTGESSEWTFGIHSLGAGREKGNSLLAVWEELGIIGLVLYVLLMLLIGLDLYSLRWGALRNPDSRFLFYVVLGTFIGSVGSSSFEAWFTAPGAPESAVFWATLGLGYRAVTAASHTVPVPSHYVVYEPA